MTNDTPGPSYLDTCRRYGLSSYAADKLFQINYRTPGPELGSPAIETNLRDLALIETHPEWSGCVNITDRGRAMRRILNAAGALDDAADVPGAPEDWSDLWQAYTEQLQRADATFTREVR